MLSRILIFAVILVKLKDQLVLFNFSDQVASYLQNIINDKGKYTTVNSNCSDSSEIVREDGSTDNTAYNNFGLLHTLQSYSKWAEEEEQIVRMLQLRLQAIKHERKLIQVYLSQRKLKQPVTQIGIGDKRKLLQYDVPVVFKNLKSLLPEGSALKNLRGLLVSEDYPKNYSDANEILFPCDENISEPNLGHPGWIGREDMLLSMTTFLQIQEVYLYLPQNISKGIEIDTSFGGQLDAVHVSEIGMFALHRERYYIALDWLEQAKQLLSMGGRRRISNSLIATLTGISIQDHNRRMQISTNDTDDDMEIDYDQYITPIRENQSNIDRISNRIDDYLNYRDVSDEARFIDLCLGNVLQTPEIQKSLTCFYERRKHPYLYINPVKVETLSESPQIFQFYEILGDQIMSKITEALLPSVKLSRMAGKTTVEEATSWRTSAGVVTEPKDIPKKVHLLAEYLSGMEITDNAECQFVEYSYGRFYKYHDDAFSEEFLETENITNGIGNRVATLLYYLELPSLGGITPFVQAGVYPRPVRGSAVLWWNMWRNGTVREDVTHGSCPVLHGYKRIMNHWIPSYSNFNRWKCSLNQFE